MSHFRNECIHGIVMGQCRCPDKNKTVNIVPCPDKCKEAVYAIFDWERDGE